MNNKRAMFACLQATAEALEAEQELKNLTKSKNTSLVAMIQQNQKSRSDRADDFFAELEKKYGGGASSRTTSPSRKKRKTSHGDTSAQSPGRRSRDGSPQKQKQQQSVQSRSPRSASSPAKKQAKKQNKNNKAAAPSKPSKDSKKKTAAKTTAKRPKK